MKSTLTLTSFIAGSLLVGGVVYSCVRANASVTPQKQAAIFEHFSYKGMDDRYDANPLPNESSFYNPILPGWYSDPSICTNGEGDYFLVTSTFTYFPGVPLFHSTDLVNWKQVGHILSRESQLDNIATQHVSGGIFAPDIAYNPANKTYYMITTNVGAGNFFVKTTDPFGEWSDPVYLPEVQGIDPAFFFDADGKAYIVNNDDAPDNKPEYPGHRTVRVVEFDTATDSCVGERKIVVNKGCRPEEKPIWCEGPHIYTLDGLYYLMTAEGGTGDWHSEVIYRGKTPFGPYEPYEGNPILTQRHLDRNRANPITCAGHADLVKTTEGDWWAVFLACRPNEEGYENLGRETFMMPVRWTSDGWPVITEGDQEIPVVVERPGVKRGDNVTFGNFEWNDDFSSPQLGMEWLTLRGAASDHYSLSEFPGHLLMKCAPVSSTQKTVIPYVGRRVQHHKYECSTRMVYRPETPDECAGMLIMKDEFHQYLLGRCCDSDSNYLVIRKIGKDVGEDLARASIDRSLDAVDLKLVSEGPTYSFLYSTDKGATWSTLLAGVDARFTSTAEAGGFTGTTVGLYATGVNQ